MTESTEDRTEVIRQTQLEQAWRRESEAYEALNRSRCAFVKILHAAHVAVKISEIRNTLETRLATDPLRMALTSDEVTRAMEELELEEPGVAKFADDASTRTAESYARFAAGPVSPTEVRRALYLLNAPQLRSVPFEVPQEPSPRDKFREGYDRIFGNKEPETCDHGKTEAEECPACDHDRYADGETDGSRL